MKAIHMLGTADDHRHSFRLGIAALVWGGVAHLLAAAVWVDLLFVPPGSHVRPMAQAVLLLALAVVAFLGGLSIALWAFHRKLWWLTLLAVAVNGSVLPSGLFVGEALAFVLGLHRGD